MKQGSHTVDSFADLLWQVDRLVQDNAGSQVSNVDDPQRRRLGFTVCSAGFEQTLWISVLKLQETFEECVVKLMCILPTAQNERDIAQLIRTAAGRQELAELLQGGLIGPTPRPAPPPPRVPGPTQWDRLLTVAW